MPSIGYNLHQYLVQMRFELERVSGLPSSLQYTDPFLIRHLNLAWQDIAKRMDIHIGENSDVSVSSAATFAIPSDTLGTRIREVSLLDSGGKRGRPLARRSFEYMNAEYDLSTTDSTAQGTPADWSFNPASTRTILIRPIPDYTIANGVFFSYIFDPAPLRFAAVWRPGKASAVITATVTAGSPTVTFSAAFNTIPVVVGAQFGVIPTVNLDQVVITNQNPDVWYEILSLATPAITLTENWLGESASGLDTVVAQVHPFETRYPGRFQYLPCLLAVADIIRGDNSQAGREMKAEVLGELDEMTPDELINQESAGRRPAHWTNMHRP